MFGILADRQNTIDEQQHLDESRNEDEEQVERFVLPVVPDNCGPQTVSLASLLELAISNTNRDFQILVELLQKKSEVERKVSILTFSNSTRAVFLKLYALVKWVKKSKKFDQLSNICYFLDQISDHFVDTADNFVQIAREELIFARLPLFQISQSVDVLSLGTLPRLPESIKTRFIHESPLNKRQKKLTLKWMQTVLNYRLVQEASNIPSGFTKVVVKDGVVIFTAPNEFNVYMTLQPTNGNPQDFGGDIELSSWRWAVNKVEMLVSDYEIGFGSSLLHPLHNHQLVDFCNYRLKHNLYDIRTVFEILHDFTLKLQLDILFCQAQYISKTISEYYVSVEVYDAQKGLLSILYWIDNDSKLNPYRITIEHDSNNANNGLLLKHHPFNCLLPTLRNQNRTPNFHTLFNKVIMIRCRERLYKIKHIFKLIVTKSACIRLIGDAAIRLNYSLLGFTDFTLDESLDIHVNTFSGKVKCNVSALEEKPKELTALEVLLDSNMPNYNKIFGLLKRLQALLLVKRYETSVSNFQFRQVKLDQLPITEKLSSLPEYRICLQFVAEAQFFLLIVIDLQREVDIDLKLYLLDFVPSKLTMIELDLQELTQSAAIADLDISKVDIRYDYAKMFDRRSFTGHTKQLQIALSTISDRIMFIKIAEELRKHGIQFEQPISEPVVGGYMMKVTDASSILMDKNGDNFFDNVVNCCIRWSSLSYVWPFECTLKNVPLVNDYKKSKEEILAQKNGLWTHVEEINPRQQTVTTLSDAISCHVVDRLKIYNNMSKAVKEFSVAYDQYFNKYCNVFLFNYHKLMLLYGQNREKICIFSWKPKMNGFLLNFAQNTYNAQNHFLPLTNNKWNPHAFVYDFLSHKYNKNHDLISPVNYLINTDRTMQCIFYFSKPELCSLKAFSLLTGIDDRNIAIEIKTHIVALSESHIRMSFGVSNLEFQLLNDNKCAIQASRPKDMSYQSENTEYISLPFFSEFWNSISGGKAIYIENSVKNKETDNQPLSVPQNNLIPSPRNPFGPLSCPPQVDVLLNNEQLSANLSNYDSFESPPISLLQSIVVDASTLEKAMIKPEEDKLAPFNEYLQGVTYLARLGPSFDSMWRNNPPKPHLPFDNLNFNSRSVRFEIMGFQFPNNNVWSISMRIYLCAFTFKVKCKLEINGPTIPAEVDIQVFESFFETAVAPLCNEFAVLSFLTICRICSPPVFVAFARLMKAHMESMSHHGDYNPQITGLNNLWRVSLQLVSNRERPQSSIILMDKSVIMTLNLRSLKKSKNDKSLNKRIVLQYNIERNELTSIPQPKTDQQEKASIEFLITDASANSPNECKIWPCIRKILENFRSIR